MKKLLSIGLTLSLTLALATPALAYSTPDFSDLPQGHWAYASVMEMADLGIIQGTGGGAFSPEATLSAEMFLTLVGRVMYPEIQVQDGEWSRPYVEALKERGMLSNTGVTAETLQKPISRYDMASVLALCAWELDAQGYGAWAKDSYFEFADGEDMPQRYAGSVSLARATGLVRGDENRRFNGNDSMTRKEAAVVIARLSYLKRSLDGTSPAALTVKDHALSVADMDYYYHNALNAAYAQQQELDRLYQSWGLGSYSYGFDPRSSLKTQYVDEEQTQSYHDYFLDQAKTTALQVLALTDAARAQGYTMSPEGQAALEDTRAELDKQVEQYFFQSRDHYLKEVYGLRMTEEVYFRNLELQALAQDYLDARVNDPDRYSDEALEAYYQEHRDELGSQRDDTPSVDFRHILLAAEKDSPAWEYAQVQAQGLLNKFLAGERTAEAFGELANRYSKDGRDSSGALFAYGGLYTGVKQGEMVEPIDSWCFDPQRQAGDTALVQSEYGWHVMYFQGAHRPSWMDQAEEVMKYEAQEALLAQVQTGYEAQEGPGWTWVGLCVDEIGG